MTDYDEITKPRHYMLFPDMEAIDVIRAVLTPEEFRGFCKGNALKYRLRAGDKGPAAKCIGKAHWYHNYLLNVMEYSNPDRADLGDFGQQNMIEPASLIDDDSPRQQGIHQGGELAEPIYDLIYGDGA